MTNTMTVDHATEIEIAKETGHQIGCFEQWMETALEAGIDEAEIYALWYEQAAKGFSRKALGKCTCEVDGVLVTDMIKILKGLGYQVTK